MNFIDWLPFVLPWAPACPDETAVHHIKQAAIRFCATTGCIRETLDPVLGDGYSTTIALPVDDQVDIAKLFKVQVGDFRRTVIFQAERGATLASRHQSDDLAYTIDRRSIFVSPAPADGDRIVATVSLKPSQASYACDDVLFDQYAQHIADGALASLLLLPKFRDKEQAAVSEGKFRAAIGSVSIQVAKGYANQWNRRRARRML